MPKEKPIQPQIIAMKKASEYTPRAPKFLWKPYFLYQKLILIQGESGIGKSTFLLNIASLLSNGKHMPFVTNDEPADVGTTLYFSKEDGAEDTTVPRLIAMGADCERVRLPEESFYLEDGCALLKNTILAYDARMVILDPVASFLSRSHNMNIAQQVGNLMRELSGVATDTNSILCLVNHVSKNSSNKEIDRGLGSSDIVNASRSVLSVSRVEEDGDIMVVRHLKASLTERGQPFFYRLVGNGLVEFMEDSDMVMCDDIPLSVEKKQRKADIAEEMILNILSNNPMKGDDVAKIVMDSTGMSISTVNAAKRAASIHSEKIGGVWWWYLPGQDVKTAAGLHLGL